MEKLNDNMLENVNGGRTVMNKSGFDYANVCADPNGKPIFKVYNGENVNLTGRRVDRGGTTWLEIADGGRRGWIAQSMLVDIDL